MQGDRRQAVLRRYAQHPVRPLAGRPRGAALLGILALSGCGWFSSSSSKPAEACPSAVVLAAALQHGRVRPRPGAAPGQCRVLRDPERGRPQMRVRRRRPEDRTRRGRRRRTRPGGEGRRRGSPVFRRRHRDPINRSSARGHSPSASSSRAPRNAPASPTISRKRSRSTAARAPTSTSCSAFSRAPRSSTSTSTSAAADFLLGQRAPNSSSRLWGRREQRRRCCRSSAAKPGHFICNGQPSGRPLDAASICCSD